MSKVDNIINKYSLKANSYKIPKEKADIDGCCRLETLLFDKWKGHIESGWYGFSLGNIPHIWYSAIDEFLDYIKTIDSKFIIRQIKLKFGECKIYIVVQAKDEILIDLDKDISKFESCLMDKRLIY